VVNTSRRDILRAAVAGSIAATVGTAAPSAESEPLDVLTSQPLDSLTFYHAPDTGWPCAHSGEPLGSLREWQFHSARCLGVDYGDGRATPDLWIIIAHHRPEGGGFQRFAWPTSIDGEVAPLDRPPTMCELKTFAAVCLAGLNAPV
jgi:hypothetical protein